jgi:hypothetical protein
LKFKIDSDENFWLPSGMGMAAMANERFTMAGATTTLWLLFGAGGSF